MFKAHEKMLEWFRFRKLARKRDHWSSFGLNFPVHGPVLLLGLTGCIYRTHPLPKNGPSFSNAQVVSSPNVMKITVAGSTCSPSLTDSGAINQACVAIKICERGADTNCQILNNLLLDTNSVGLRIFKNQTDSALNQILASWPKLHSPSGPELFTCLNQTPALWGNLVQGTVILGDENSIELPIQLISGDGNASMCPGSSGISIDAIGYAGVFGILPSESDQSSNSYRCGGAGDSSDQSCVLETLDVNRLKNPVSALDQDNQGYVISLPSIFGYGAKSVTGSLILGNGSQTNNTPSSLVRNFIINPENYEFITKINGAYYSKTSLRTATPYLAFDPPAADAAILTTCSEAIDGVTYFCPHSQFISMKATLNALGFNPVTTTVQIGDASILFSTFGFTSLNPSINYAFSNLAAPSSNGSDALILGLPYFFGKKIYFVIKNGPVNPQIGI